MFTKLHVLTQASWASGSPDIPGLLCLEYDGVHHFVPPHKKLPDGKPAFPPIEQLTPGTVIRVTYEGQPVADPLLSSAVPQILQAEIVGTARQYEIILSSSPISTRELASANEIAQRIQRQVGPASRVLGIREVR